MEKHSNVVGYIANDANQIIYNKAFGFNFYPAKALEMSLESFWLWFKHDAEELGFKIPRFKQISPLIYNDAIILDKSINSFANFELPEYEFDASKNNKFSFKRMDNVFLSVNPIAGDLDNYCGTIQNFYDKHGFYPREATVIVNKPSIHQMEDLVNIVSSFDVEYGEARTLVSWTLIYV